MSLYNMVFGVNPVAFYVLPMISSGHHPDTWPRFRDCFVGDEEHPEHDGKIIVFTRTGGGNRDDYEDENDWIRGLSGFVTDYDDSFDETFACWVFDVPEKWKADFDKLMENDMKSVSTEYQLRLRSVYPKLSDRWDEIWPKTSVDTE